MTERISAIAFNTFREAIRDRVLYNLILFALLLVGSAVLFGQISIGIERIVVINLSLTSISIFGVRSEEHTSELQSQFHLVCRLLLEIKNAVLLRSMPYQVSDR